MRLLILSMFTALTVVGCGDDTQSSSASTTSGTGTGAQGGGGSPAGGAGGDGATGAVGGGGEGGEPVTALVHRVGRFDESDPTAPQFTWSGTSFRTRVDGAGVSVSLGGAADVFFEVVVDGESMGTFVTTGGDMSYPVASGLSDGTHDVEIHRRNEGFFGNVSFHGFAPQDGASLVESPSPYLHRIEFIGDSITCGYGIEGPDAFCNFSGDTENAYATYAAIAARNVSASAHLIAFSGKGVFQNYAGDKVELMPELYERTLTNAATPAWDFSTYAPDAVVLNLGTNDFSANITQNEFVGAYVDFLGTIRSHHPDAAIFCVSWELWGATHQAWVGDAIAQFADANVREVVFAVNDADGWGCDYHPGELMHEKLAVTLTNAFQTTLGW